MVYFFKKEKKISGQILLLLFICRYLKEQAGVKEKIVHETNMD
jgi:hypothetical protein